MAERLIKAKAPGRCGILGNPSDIYGGKVLSCSIPAYATCILAESDTWSLPQDPKLWNATQVRFPVGTPVSLTWATDIPLSSGLSGSTALLAATLASVLAFRGERPKLATASDRISFSELVRDVERNAAGIVCGYQDAYMIVHGGLQLMDFAGKNPTDSGPPATLVALDAPLPFLLVTTGVERLSGAVHGPLVQRWLNGEDQVRHSIAEISRLAEPGAEWLVNGDLAKLGAAMDRNHSLVAGMGASGKEIDELVALCKGSGAIGAKLAGAGLGGTVIALTEEPDSLERKLRELGYTKFLRPKQVPGVSFECQGNVI